MFHMPLFMGISGYLSYNGIVKSSLSKLFVRKISTYIIPIFAWSFVFRFVISISIRSHSLREFPVELVNQVFSNGGGFLWFIWALCGCLMLTAAIRTLHGNFWLFYALSTPAVLFLPGWDFVSSTKYMYPFFQVGFALAACKEGWFRRANSPVVAVCLFWASIVCYHYWNKNTYVYVSGTQMSVANLGNLALRCVSGIIISAFVLLLLHATHARIWRRLGMAIEALGMDSICIYIIHGYLMAALVRALHKTCATTYGLWLGSFIAIICGIGITGVCFVVERIMSRNAFVDKVMFGKHRRLDKASSDARN
jgi:fucose 4-O-acetylase-like acetyltransferase